MAAGAVALIWVFELVNRISLWNFWAAKGVSWTWIWPEGGTGGWGVAVLAEIGVA